MVECGRGSTPFIMENKKRNNDPWVPLPEEAASISQAPQNPLYQMIDSDRYIQTLERKLAKLTTSRKKEPTSRDIISSLALFHEDQMRRYVADTTLLDSGLPMTSNTEESVTQTSFVQRKLHPERQPLSAEEIAELIKEDIMAKAFEAIMDNEEGKAEATKALNNTSHVTQYSVPVSVSSHSSATEDIGTAANVKPHTHQSENSESPQTGVTNVEVEENWANFDEMQEQTTEQSTGNS